MVQELCIIRPRVRSATCALTKFFYSNKAEKDVKQHRHTSASLHKLHLQHILEIQGQSSGEKQFFGGLVVGWVDFLCLSERSLIKITWRTTVCVCQRPGCVIAHSTVPAASLAKHPRLKLSEQGQPRRYMPASAGLLVLTANTVIFGKR